MGLNARGLLTLFAFAATFAVITAAAGNPSAEPTPEPTFTPTAPSPEPTARPTNPTPAPTQLSTSATIPVMNMSAPLLYKRHNWCTQMNDVALGKLALKDVLRGNVVSIGVEPAGTVDAAYMTFDAVSGYPTGGFFYTMWTKVAEKAGFYIDWYQLPAKGATQALAVFAKSVVKTVDVAGGRVISDSTSNRQTYNLDFTSTLLDGSQYLYMPSTPIQEKGIWNFATPFSNGLWGILVALMITHAATFYYFHEWDPEDEWTAPVGAGSVLVGTMGHFVQGTKLAPKRLFLQLLNLGFCFCCTILANTYTANLASSLISSSSTTKSINDINDANRLRIKVCVQSGTNAATILSTYFTGIRQIAQPVYAALGLSKGECTALYLASADFDIAVSRKDMNSRCDLIPVGDVVRSVNYAVALNLDYSTYCTSFMSQAMTPYFLNLKANGFTDQAWNDAIASVSDLTCPAVAEKTLALGVVDIQGVFILYAICIGVSLFIYFFGNRAIGPVYAVLVGGGGTIVTKDKIVEAEGEGDTTTSSPRPPA